MIWRHRAASAVAALRQVWLMIGAVVIVLLLVESCYRVQAVARGAVRSISSEVRPPHPYANFAWYPAIDREEEQSSALQWKPYVYFRRRPFSGRYISVDSAGHRRTLQPSMTDGNRGSVMFFGGSTMFGTAQRDTLTIASRVAARMRTLPPLQRRFEVMNLGETGYVFTQSVLELEMQLREGRRPSVAVFYDGINDVVAGIQNRRGGIPQNEQNRATEFALGRVIFNWRDDLRTELSVATTLAFLGLRRLTFVQRLTSGSGSRVRTELSSDSIALMVATSYVETARIVEALARQYDFKALYVWQPNFHATSKVLTPYEEQLQDDLEANPFHRKVRSVHQLMPALVGSRMRRLVGDRFVDASSVYDGDSTAVFVDVIGHTTEAAVGPVVEAIWPPFARLLAASSGTPSPGDTALLALPFRH